MGFTGPWGFVPSIVYGPLSPSPSQMLGVGYPWLFVGWRQRVELKVVLPRPYDFRVGSYPARP